MKTINTYLTERLKINSDTKIQTEEERILVFPLYLNEYNQISNLIKGKKGCLELENDDGFSIFIIPNEFINILCNNIQSYKFSNKIYAYELPNNKSNKEIENEWKTIVCNNGMYEIKQYLKNFNELNYEELSKL